MRHNPRKRYNIEWRLVHWGDNKWTKYSCYLTEASREEALSTHLKKKGERYWCEFRRGNP